jgi:hypothetical protein
LAAEKGQADRRGTAAGNAPIGRLLRAKQNFSGRLVVGEDLMRIGVGKPLGRS